MTTRKQLCKIIQAATGLDEFTIWRIADALGEAGTIPPSDKSEVLPVDAATLLYAAAAARFPDEAVECVEAARRYGLVSVNLKDIAGVWYTLDLHEGRALMAHAGLDELQMPLDWFEFLLDPLPGDLRTIARTVDVGCGSDAAFVEFTIDVVLRINGELIIGGLRLGYGDLAGQQKPLQNIRRLDGSIFLDLIERLNLEHPENQARDAADAARVN